MPKIRLDFSQRYTRAVTRAEKFFARGSHKHVVDFDKLQAGYLEGNLERWPRFYQLAKAGAEKYPVFEDFLRDMFFALYLYEPRYRGADELLSTHKANAMLMAQTHQLPIWSDARQHSTLNRLNTMLGLVHVAQALLDNLPEEAQQSAKAAQEAAEGSEGLDEAIQQLLDQAQQQQQQGQGEAADESLAQAEAALDAAESQAQASVSDDAARQAMRKAMDKATKEMANFESTLKAWGTDPGEIQHLPPDQVMALYDRMRGLPHFKEFTDEIGRHRAEAIAASRQLGAREAQEIVDVETGRGLTELLPNERIALLDPDLEATFWARWAQEGLLNWAYAGRESAAKGPAILCVDVSGSTLGNRERWGKAFVLASLDLCAKQGRDVAVIFFDTDVKPAGIFTFPRGRADLARKLELAEYYTGGGTNFVPALTIALENIAASEGEWKEADIVLVTDGWCQVSQEFTDMFRHETQLRGVRTHGVLLDGSPQALDYIKPLVDRAVSVQSLQDSPRALFDRLAG